MNITGMADNNLRRKNEYRIFAKTQPGQAGIED
jgi:hypothetical protein